MKRFLLPLIFLAATAAQANEAAHSEAPKADLAKGKATAATVCVACHGADGNSTIPANPKLAGQHADYIAKQLREFKSNTRSNPVMLGMASACPKTTCATWPPGSNPRNKRVTWPRTAKPSNSVRSCSVPAT